MQTLQITVNTPTRTTHHRMTRLEWVEFVMVICGGYLMDDQCDQRYAVILATTKVQTPWDDPNFTVTIDDDPELTVITNRHGVDYSGAFASYVQNLFQ